MTAQAICFNDEPSITPSGRQKVGHYVPDYAKFATWAARRRNCPSLVADAKLASAGVVSLRSVTPAGLDAPSPGRAARSDDRPSQLPKRRGRPAVIAANPVADLMPLLMGDRPSWIDDIVYGSTAVSAGAHKGRLNVRVSDVFTALFLSTISTAGIKRPGMSDRSAQSIARAARNAAAGIWHYVHRHSEVRDELMILLELERELAPRQLPQGI